MEKESKNQNLNLIWLIFVLVSIFTFIIGVSTWINFFWGMVVTFGLLALLACFLIIEWIKAKYDLLLNSPAPGQPVKQFVIKALGKELWKYPPDGAFVFTPPALPETPGDYDPMKPPKKRKWRFDAEQVAKKYWEEWERGGLSKADYSRNTGFPLRTLYDVLKAYPIEYFQKK